MSDLRIPFLEAVNEPRLLRHRFFGDGQHEPGLSLPQQVALKAFYGSPLQGDVRDDRGFSELDYWWASQGFALYDPYGYLLSVTHPLGGVYHPQEYQEAWGIWGIRAGKSDTFAATTTVYEAVCGGHEAHTRPGKRLIVFQISQDLAAAQYALHAIRATLESMPLIARASSAARHKEKIQAVTARRIDLWNGVTIVTAPPTVKSVRGYDSPAAVMDEVAVWWQEEESANPDFEIYRQVRSRQAQFSDPKIIGITSPWNKAGLAHQRYEVGTNGGKLRCEACRGLPLSRPDCTVCQALQAPYRGWLVMHGTTAGLGNPLVTREWLQDTQQKDPRAFERECLAVFQDSVSGFLDARLLREAVDAGVIERPPQPLNFYVAAIDPAFRGDAFGFCIAHHDGERVIIDVLRRRVPPPGKKLNPLEVFEELAPLLRQYRVYEVLADQYQIDALTVLAAQRGIAIRQVNFTPKSKAQIYGNFQQLLNQKRIRLLDDPETFRELASIERKTLQGGNVRIAAPADQHDDMATVVALATHGAVWLTPAAPTPDAKEPTVFEQCQAQIERKRMAGLQDDVVLYGGTPADVADW